MAAKKPKLSVTQRTQIISESERRAKANEDTSQTQLALWAQREFRLDKAPNQATISRVLRDKQKLSSLANTSSKNFKSVRTAAHPRLEAALYVWMKDCISKGKQLNADVLRLQAETLQRKANDLLPTDEKINLVFSNGWLDRFKKRYGLRYRRVQGEALSADQQKIDASMPEIREKLQTMLLPMSGTPMNSGYFFGNPRDGHLLTDNRSGTKWTKVEYRCWLAATLLGRKSFR